MNTETKVLNQIAYRIQNLLQYAYLKGTHKSKTYLELKQIMNLIKPTIENNREPIMGKINLPVVNLHEEKEEIEKIVETKNYPMTIDEMDLIHPFLGKYDITKIANLVNRTEKEIIEFAESLKSRERGKNEPPLPKNNIDCYYKMVNNNTIISHYIKNQ